MIVPASAAPEPVKTIKKKADVGMTGKGQGYGNSIIFTPVASLWAVRERLVLDQIHQAMDLFKATEDRAPKSHDEFMEKIIKDNHIHLPELPAGDRYQYDPKTGDLMIQSPERK